MKIPDGPDPMRTQSDRDEGEQSRGIGDGEDGAARRAIGPRRVTSRLHG
jgi:hypothetical protein